MSFTAYSSTAKPPSKLQAKPEKLNAVPKEIILQKYSFSSKKVNQSVPYPSNKEKESRPNSKSRKLTSNKSQSKFDSRKVNSKLKLMDKNKKQVTNPSINYNIGNSHKSSIRTSNAFDYSELESKNTKVCVKKSLKFSTNTRNSSLLDHNVSKLDADGSSNETLKRSKSKKSSSSLNAVTENIIPRQDAHKNQHFNSEKTADANRKFSILDIPGTVNPQAAAKITKMNYKANKKVILKSIKNFNIKCLFLMCTNK